MYVISGSKHKIDVLNVSCVIARSFTAESEGKSIMRWLNERGSLGITDVVNVICIAGCLSKVIATTEGSFTVQLYSQTSDYIKYTYRLSKRSIDNKMTKLRNI